MLLCELTVYRRAEQERPILDSEHFGHLNRTAIPCVDRVIRSAVPWTLGNLHLAISGRCYRRRGINGGGINGATSVVLAIPSAFAFLYLLEI